MAAQKIAYASSANLTFTSLASLAASSTWVGGAESAAVDNTTNLYVDYLLSGAFTAGASNTQVGTILVYVIGMRDDSTWPDVFDGTDSAETVTSANVLANFGKLAASMAADSSANRIYDFGPVSVASLFGGTMPHKFVVFVTHNIQTSTNTWAATGNQVTIKGVYYTVA
jgi:hypothetical protein